MQEQNEKTTNETSLTPEVQEQIKQVTESSNGQQPIVIINQAPEQKPSELEQALTGRVRNRWIAAILCFFLFWCGAYQFYCGWTARGIAMIILTITLVGGFVNAIWALVNFIQILMGKFKCADGEML